MKHSYFKMSLLFCSAMLLAACNNNNPNNVDAGALQQLVNGNANGESQEIMDQPGLEQNIASLFGTADGEPVAVNSHDTVISVIQRINNN